MQDTIQREVTINASKKRIYEAIANPEQVTKWFPETLEGSYTAPFFLPSSSFHVAISCSPHLAYDIIH